MTAKKDMDNKRELARHYYMQGEAQVVFASKVGKLGFAARSPRINTL